MSIILWKHKDCALLKWMTCIDKWDSASNAHIIRKEQSTLYVLQKLFSTKYYGSLEKVDEGKKREEGRCRWLECYDEW